MGSGEGEEVLEDVEVDFGGEVGRGWERGGRWWEGHFRGARWFNGGELVCGDSEGEGWMCAVGGWR